VSRELIYAEDVTLATFSLGKVFLSHSSVDKAMVRTLAQDIEAAGYSIWLDERELLPGDKLLERIAEAVSTSRVMLVVISRASVTSKWLRQELTVVSERMVRGECRVIPVLIEDVEIPSELRGLVYADIRSNYSDGLGRIVNAIRQEMEQWAPLFVPADMPLKTLAHTPPAWMSQVSSPAPPFASLNTHHNPTLLRAGNYTREGASKDKWRQRVEAKVGEVVAFDIFYHVDTQEGAILPRKIPAFDLRAELMFVRIDKLIIAHARLSAGNATAVYGSCEVQVHDDPAATFAFVGGEWYRGYSDQPLPLPGGPISFFMGNVAAGCDHQGDIIARFLVVQSR
jgi:hypothetical protein